ncbi:PDZ and LIM domain protein 7 [Mycteria americana]|uniref:PDZ and LIM domain protein 7 n=1 Tax=Mycteria americana TaxID=33587 RepID=UPI003F588BC9
MGDMESYKVMLNGPAPWGFRLQGGKDFSMPLSISRLTPGGKAAQAGVGVGDWVLYIDGESTSSMTHIEAQNRIRACGDRLCLTLSRAQNHLGKPQKDSLPCSEPLKYNFAPSTALNKTARPFGAGSPPNPRPGLVTKPVTYVPLAPACTPQHNGVLPALGEVLSLDKSYPILQGRASLGQAAHAALPVRVGHSRQQAVLSLKGERCLSLLAAGALEHPRNVRHLGYWCAVVLCWWRCGTVPGRSCRGDLSDLTDDSVTRRQPLQPLEPPSSPVCDPVKLRLIEDAEDWQPRTGTSQSRSFRKLAQLMGTDSMEDREDELVKKPRDARGSGWGTGEQWQPPQPLEPPSSPVCDPAKLQLIEDAEDWQPRTGTSQSRSFRKLAQLMGTDGLEDREDELVKKPRQPPQPLEPPSSPVCDPGKSQLIEDAEDWQPRTGTSQSRSFRKLAQLMGTDGMEDREDELVKKPRAELLEELQSPPCACPAMGTAMPGSGEGVGVCERGLWQCFPVPKQGPCVVLAERLPSVTRRQPPQPLEPPSSPVCDPGKLRLMEDAEDWQPRTGTSQSRSFRKLAQLTGTDGLEDHDDVFIKKPSQVSVLDPSPGAAMKTEPGLAPRTPAATPGPASRPPWAVDPSFAERYAPDKTSTVVSKHSQPATPTPMQNRSSIVQAAQQAPEGPGRTPLCYKCNKVIRGRYLVALGHYYHPEEFTCCQCRKVLDEGGFFEEKGSIFCPKCYDTRYAPSCAKCKKKIAGEVMHALKMTWHVQCFTCAACKTPIRNRAFYMEEGQPYCERDYEKMFGTKCRGCDFKIDAGDRFLEALGFSWHDTCFVCAICQTNLEGKTFYSKKDKPLCKSHAFSHV